jgi:predicted RNA-binding protein YlqC (UPF0109 family)
MKEALANLVRSLVGNPDAVEVIEKQNGSTTVLQVRVEQADVGRLIGREGRTIKAVRSILYAISHKQGRRYQLEIAE